MTATPRRHQVADTSERLNPTYYLSSQGDAFIYACHLATYDYARPHVRGKRVLDFGCGTGYGTHRLAAECAEIVGVDVSPAAITAATEAFTAPGLSFRCCEKVEDSPLPFDDAQFDVVLSFQVFEHLVDTEAYLREVRRVLAPGGTFICVTPDRRSRLFPGQRPWNRYHIKEYSPSEMADHLGPHFESVEVAGMTARADLLAAECKRARKVKLVTYAVTFPGVPESLRLKGLTLIKKLQSRRGPVPGHTQTSQKTLQDWGFDESDVLAFTHDTPSLNVMCVARTAN